MIIKIFDQRYKWLKKDLKRIDKIIREFPFKYEVKLEGIKQVREGIRMDYDKTKEKLDAYNVLLGKEKEKEWKEQDHKIIDNAQKQIKLTTEDLTNMEKQMEELDLESKETEMTKNSRIEAARSYRGLILRLLKK